MSSPTPAGPPSIRTDWLLDVAWRLAVIGLGVLRSPRGEGPWHLEDTLDGERWRLSSNRVAEPWDTAIEHDADLWLPGDPDDRPSLRLGIGLTPWFDAERGRCLRARVEVGPRGPVTFDPENWMTLLDAEPSVDSAPAVAGLTRGGWRFDGIAPGGPVATGLGDAVGLALGADADKPPAGEQDPVSALWLPLATVTERRGLLRRRPSRDWVAPVVLVADADGPITTRWSGARPLDDSGGVYLVAATPEVRGDQAEISTAEGSLILTGPGLRLRAVRAES